MSDERGSGSGANREHCTQPSQNSSGTPGTRRPRTRAQRRLTAFYRPRDADDGKKGDHLPEEDPANDLPDEQRKETSGRKGIDGR